MTPEATRQLGDLYRLQADALTARLARKVGREDAEDIVMQAFVRLGERLEREPVKDAPALLGTIITGLLKNHYRDSDARATRETPVGEFHDELHPVHDLTLDDLEFSEDLDAALRGLDEDIRDAFILTELRGLTLREAGDVLGVDNTTVMRRAERARQELVQQIGPSRGYTSEGTNSALTTVHERGVIGA